MSESNWSDYLEVLRKKWSEIPAGDKRIDSEQMEHISDHNLLRQWLTWRREQTEGDAFSLRGWYHRLYAPILKGKKVLDVGSGAGVDGITFAQSGAEVTFLDIVESNIRMVKRLCQIQKVRNVDFLYLENADSLKRLGKGFDFFWCQGSMITAPFDIVRQESRALLRHLRPVGRWIELGYPKTRWQREGEQPFETWGASTDGGAPWIEWYDLNKLLRRLEPTRFKPVLCFEFHNGDFNWFDLQRQS